MGNRSESEHRSESKSENGQVGVVVAVVERSESVIVFYQ